MVNNKTEIKHLIMGTAGHVDHGKTALIKALTNIDCDTHKEEKARGITINLGFSHVDLPSGNALGIIDVPGHKDFINTMVGGASGIDFVLLVIAADSGIMPQTEEHLNIIRTLKIKHAIVALSKIDLVDADLVELAKLEIMDWLDKTEFKDASIVGVSSKTGEGLDQLLSEIDSLIPKIKEKESGSFFRMYIDRIFTVKGIGSVVTGSVLNGAIEKGKELFLLPGNKQKLKIRSVQRHGKEVDKVVTGDRAAFNLTGLKSEDFKRGLLLSNKQLETTQMIDAHVSLFENTNRLNLWSSIVFYSGTFESQGRMHLLNRDTIASNEEAIVQIHLEKEAILLNKDKFVIRNTSGDKSLGGGVVIDAQPLHHRKRTEKLIDDLELLSASILNENKLSELIKLELKKENKALSILNLAENLNHPIEEIREEIKNIQELFIYSEQDSEILILPSVEENFKQDILSHIDNYHQKNSILDNGLSPNDLYGKLKLSKDKIGEIYIGFLLEKMASLDLIVQKNKRWQRSGFKVLIPEKTEQEINRLEQMILNFDAQKPALSEIKVFASEQNINTEKLRLYIAYLAEKNKIKYIDSDFVHIKNIDKFREAIIKKLQTSEEGFFFGELREAIGLTKRLIPILLKLFEKEGWLTILAPENNKVKVKLTEKGKSF